MIRGALLAAALLPGIGATDPRAPVDVYAWPWSAVVLVQSPGVSRCTGFLIDPRHVVTAAHCLYSNRVGHLVQPNSVHVLAGFHNGAFAAHAVAVVYRVPGGWSPSRERETSGADVAVLTLGSPVAPRGLPLTEPKQGQMAMLGGYERDRAEILIADQSCRVTGVEADRAGRPLWRHSCTGTFGASGAPLLVRDAAGTWAAAGVMVAAFSTHAGGVVVPSATIAALIASK